MADRRDKGVSLAKGPVGIIGMVLHRQPFAGEEILDQQLGRSRIGVLEPYFADRIAARGGIGEAWP